MLDVSEFVSHVLGEFQFSGNALRQELIRLFRAEPGHDLRDLFYLTGMSSHQFRYFFRWREIISAVRNHFIDDKIGRRYYLQCFFADQRRFHVVQHAFFNHGNDFIRSGKRHLFRIRFEKYVRIKPSARCIGDHLIDKISPALISSGADACIEDKIIRFKSDLRYPVRGPSARARYDHLAPDAVQCRGFAFKSRKDI